MPTIEHAGFVYDIVTDSNGELHAAPFAGQGRAAMKKENLRAALEKYLEAKIREIARRVHGTDEIEIDEDAEVLPSTDGGSWVAAWVYLSNETLDEQEVTWTSKP